MKTSNELYVYGIIGGSWTGKTEQIRLFKQYLSSFIKFSVSATSREKSDHEVDGRDYYFLSLEVFKKLVREKKFLETNTFATGSRYGTLMSELMDAREHGLVLLVDLEANGAIRIWEQYPNNCRFVYLDVTDTEALRRSENSSTRKREKKIERIQNLQRQRELSVHECFDLRIDTTNLSIEEVFTIIKADFLNELNVRNQQKINTQQ